ANGQRTPGCAGNSRGSGYKCATCIATIWLSERWDSSGPPTDINQPVPETSGIKKSHPSSTDSIQQVAGSARFSSCTGTTVAVLFPNELSRDDVGRGREETIVQSCE